MIITLSRSGGFTGIPFKKAIDTKELQPEAAQKIEELVLSSEFLKKQSVDVSPATHKPDQFTYTIRIEDEVMQQTLEIPENKLTIEMKKLIEYVQEN